MKMKREMRKLFNCFECNQSSISEQYIINFDVIPLSLRFKGGIIWSEILRDINAFNMYQKIRRKTICLKRRLLC